MARQDQKTTERRGSSDQRRKGNAEKQNSHAWYGDERENEFGGEGRFRAEGAHGSHFGGEPEALRNDRPDQRNTSAWRGERRKQFMEKFERWRSERAARTASSGPGKASADSAPAGGRNAKK